MQESCGIREGFVGGCVPAEISRQSELINSVQEKQGGEVVQRPEGERGRGLREA